MLMDAMPITSTSIIRNIPACSPTEASIVRGRRCMWLLLFGRNSQRWTMWLSKVSVSTIRWDWRLMAAQCYQESTFDPQARSWAGACGLMQIMPGTADHLGLPRASIYDPEQNIAAAARYLGELDRTFSDIPERTERTKFVLAAYNGGHFHIRDAMALAQKNGKNPKRWGDVEPFVLGLSQAQYYNDPVVKYGYMRGSETVDYVRKIHERWNGYRGVRTIRSTFAPSGIPQKARHERKKKYQI